MNEISTALDHFADAVFAGRWILVFLAGLVAVAFVGDANSRADYWQQWADDLEQENDELRAQLSTESSDA